jgi:hypothetical protein
MILLKEVKDHHIRFRLQMKDESTLRWGGDGWTTLGYYIDCPQRLIPILYGLRIFPEEIREKIYTMHVYQKMEEDLVLCYLDRDIYRTWAKESFRLFTERMEDYAAFCNVLEDLGINMLNNASEISDYFDETYEFLWS